MLVHLCFVSLAIVGVQRGLCLKCYTCLSNERNDDCDRIDKNKVPLKTCERKELENTEQYAKKINQNLGKLYEVDAAQEPLPPLNCLKQVTKHGNKHYVLRGCQLATSDNLDICMKVKKEETDLLKTPYCTLCNSDGCNSATLERPLMSSFLTFCMTLLGFLIVS